MVSDHQTFFEKVDRKGLPRSARVANVLTMVAKHRAVLLAVAAELSGSVGHGQVRSTMLATGVLRVDIRLDAFTVQHGAIAKGVAFRHLEAAGIRSQVHLV